MALTNLEFFDVVTVKEDAPKDDVGSNPQSALSNVECLCWTSGGGRLVFGDHLGNIRMYDRGMKCQQFNAYKGPVMHLHQIKSVKYLVSIGDDRASSHEQQQIKVKVWTVDRGYDQPTPLQTMSLFNQTYPAPEGRRLVLNLNPDLDLEYEVPSIDGDKPPTTVKQSSFTSPVTCLDVTEDLKLLAVGLTNGDVILGRGHLINGLRQSQLRRIAECTSRTREVTFLQFRMSSPSANTGKDYSYNLHVVYHDAGTIWNVNSSSSTPTPLETQVTGGLPGNCCMSADGTLAIAQTDTLHFFGGADMVPGEQRGSQRPAGGSLIKKLGIFRHYYFVIARVDTLKDQLSVYDLQNRIRATLSNQCYFPNIVCVLVEWNNIFVLHQKDTKDGRVHQQLFQLEEKDTQPKLDLLFKSNKYNVAIELAKAQQFDVTAVTEIHRKFGDYLYGKSDYAGAVRQYIATIGHLEPSYVIRRFLDAQQIPHLTIYLEELHGRRDNSDRPLANEDHTTLLLNCYTKQKDEQKLNDFIAEDRAYNPETAIKVLRQAGYFNHALNLARKFNEHSLYLSVQVEDLKCYEEALTYIQTLDFSDAEKQLQEYGKILVSKKPMKATELLREICTRWKHGSGDQGSRVASANPDQFLSCFVDMPHYLMVFLEVVKNDLDKRPNSEDSEVDKEKKTMVYNTLLELYLTANLKQPSVMEEDDSDSELNNDYESRKEKALALLRSNKGKYDREHALVLVQTHNFREGILYLYESLGLYQDILQYYMDIGDKDEVINTCKRFGKQDPNMWVQVLLYFVSLQKKDDDVTLEMQDVLKKIDEENLLPPLVVVEILGRSTETHLDTIKDYIIKRLEKDMHAISKDQQEIRQLQALTHQYRKQIVSQQSEAQIFLLNCAICDRPLELPTVHFMCNHSFHQSCLSESDKCSVCSAGFAQTLDHAKQLEEAVEDHQPFFRQLSQPGQDGFSVVSEYFGRSIFNGEYPAPPSM